jgi:hypothetical protein
MNNGMSFALSLSESKLNGDDDFRLVEKAGLVGKLRGGVQESF